MVCNHDSTHVVTETATTTATVTQEQSCENAELTTYTATFENAAFTVQTKENVETKAALTHEFGTPTYVWADDNSTVTATRVCGHDGEHKERETVETVARVTQEQTCENTELTTYTATFTNEAFETQTKADVQTKDALSHSWGTPTYTWAEDNSTVTATRVCGHNGEHKETETVEVTANVTQEVSHTTDELTTYTATFTNTAFEEQTKDVVTKVKVTECVYERYATSETQHFKQCLYCENKLEGEDHSCTTKEAWAQGRTCDVCEYAMKAENALLAHYTFDDGIKNEGVDTNVKGTGVTNDGNFTDVDMVSEGKVVAADGTSNLTMKVAHIKSRPSFRLSNIDTGTGDFTISAKIYQSGTIGKTYDSTKDEGWEFQHYLMGTADADVSKTNVSKPFFNIRLAQVKSAVMKLQVIVNGEVKVLDGYITSKSWVEYRVVKEGNTVTVSTHFTYTGTNATIKPSSVTYELESPEDLRLDPSYFLGFGYNYGTTAPGNDSFVDDIKIWNYAVDFSA